ncbi:hypothetical protein L599_002000000210 [Luteimonas sp. J16]|mgnify:CR=1 FL=1|uniref:hypothetical protein n=1 Tax=unclassified Luteimonas TaxID=2629088 RepID=UPI0004B4A178|nr:MULTISPECIES: hypothetical protein [unclassified Luteimonas]TWG91922.1 hypothetical protein L599_002000000210 [Luteimonas sp. J16]
MAPGTRTRIRPLLCLLLAFAALPVAARQPAMMDANGGSGGACPLSADAEAEETEAELVRTQKKAAAPPATRSAPARRGAETSTTTRPPRWHSFLPGMIR